MITPKLPNSETLQPLIDQLEKSPGSIVLIAIEPAESICNFCRVNVGWFSREERKELKAALERARRKRQQAPQP